MLSTAALSQLAGARRRSGRLPSFTSCARHEAGNESSGRNQLRGIAATVGGTGGSFVSSSPVVLSRVGQFNPVQPEPDHRNIGSNRPFVERIPTTGGAVGFCGGGGCGAFANNSADTRTAIVRLAGKHPM